MTSVQLAYKEWAETAVELHSDGRCCYHPHYTEFEGRMIDPLGDHEVCIREKRWRQYVRERDANYDFPWHVRETHPAFQRYKRGRE